MDENNNGDTRECNSKGYTNKVIDDQLGIHHQPYSTLPWHCGTYIHGCLVKVSRWRHSDTVTDKDPGSD